MVKREMFEFVEIPPGTQANVAWVLRNCGYLVTRAMNFLASAPQGTQVDNYVVFVEDHKLHSKLEVSLPEQEPT